jgi:N utilization substance protein A
VLDELKEIEGLTPAMLVALGEAGIKSVEDLAGCSTDELIGWTERKAGGAVKHKGALSDLEVGTDEANDFIMKARITAGWIEAPVEPAAQSESGEVGA